MLLFTVFSRCLFPPNAASVVPGQGLNQAFKGSNRVDAIWGIVERGIDGSADGGGDPNGSAGHSQREQGPNVSTAPLDSTAGVYAHGQPY